MDVVAAISPSFNVFPFAPLMTSSAVSPQSLARSYVIVTFNGPVAISVTASEGNGDGNSVVGVKVGQRYSVGVNVVGTPSATGEMVGVPVETTATGAWVVGIGVAGTATGESEVGEFVTT